MTENIEHEFFIWEEKNLIEPQKNYENKIANEDCGFTTETKNDLTQKDWRDITNPKLREKMRKKAYYEANKDKIKLQKKAYNVVNRDKIKLQTKAYAKANRDKIKVQRKSYQEANKDKIRVQKNNYHYNKLKTDIQYKLSFNLRNRLNLAINNNQKAGSAVKDLGCTIEKFKVYLESKFQPGMSWDNWTIDGWHIDHIKPLTSFDLTNKQQFLEACHYTNLQPMWAKDNLIKSDKII